MAQHDEIFKLLLDERRMIVSFLRTYGPLIGIPLDWIRTMDFRTLIPLSAENVSEALLKRCGDLAWRVTMRRRRGDPFKRYVIFRIELQSTIDPGMPMRMLEYIFMMQQGLDPEVYAPDGKLTLVIPLVVYTGPRRWNITNNTADLYHAIGTTPIHQVLGNLIYLPVDLGAMMSDDLPDGGLMSCLIRQHNAVSASEVWSVLTDVFKMLRKIEPSQHRIRRGFYEHARQLTVLRHDDQIPSLEDLERQVLAGGKNMKTLSEVNGDRWYRQMRGEARRVGLEEGRKEGLEQGLEQGQKSLLRDLTAKQFGTDTADKLARRISRINNPACLTEIGEWILECKTGEEFIDRVQHQRGLPPKKAGAHS